ncbi:DUF6297 family protein [Nonomuraea sp. NPDC047897]|uniref:DUF6297 family protein n=1 Tax=Nonomuraea sp. NPDC047897 TaxID=3364346 RepID=UPI003723852B
MNVPGRAPATPSSVRAFVRSRRARPAGLLDRYMTVFGVLMAAAVLGNPLSAALAGLAGRMEPARAAAGLALVAVAWAAFVALARVAGPVALPAADAAWLVLSPLDRRGVLARTARVLLATAVVVGAVLGLAALAALGAPDALVWRLVAAVVLGVSATAGTMALAVLGQATPTWNGWLTAVTTALLLVAVLLGVAAMGGRAWSAFGPVTVVLTWPAALADASPAWVAAVAGGAASAAALLVRRAWSALGHMPARAVLAASTRVGHVATATTTLDPSALTWAAEDNHWRTRRLRSRPWPSFPAPFALAWHDWRRAARRPGRLVALPATAVLPTVLAQALGGTAGGAAPGLPPIVVASVLAGAVAVAVVHTAGSRRDGDNPALSRLAGVGRRPALAARALLPALLGGAWAAAALAGLMLVGALPAGPTAGLGGAWWLFGPAMAPAVAAGALRMARRGPVDHSMPVIDTPGGAIPTGPLFWALTGVDLAVLGCLPALAALAAGPDGIGGLLAAQVVTGLAVLAGYVLRAGSSRRP